MQSVCYKSSKENKWVSNFNHKRYYINSWNYKLSPINSTKSFWKYLRYKKSTIKVKIKAITACQFEPKIIAACAPTPAAPIVFAKVFNVRIEDIDLSIFCFTSLLNQQFWAITFLSKLSIYEEVEDKSVASSSEHIKDKISVKSKYVTSSVIFKFNY